MKPIAAFLCIAALAAAQAIPNRYIVEFETAPAAAVSAARNVRYDSRDPDVVARRTEILAEHAQAAPSITGLGGSITNHYTTLLNAMAVTMNAAAAAQIRQMAGVRGVYPVKRHKTVLDHAVNVHRVPQAWQTLTAGPASGGAGIKIGILDTGIDIGHPAFQGFQTPVPAGFPVVSSPSEMANTNQKVIGSRVYSDIAGGIDNTNSSGLDYNGHGTGVAMAAAGLTNDPVASSLAFGVIFPAGAVNPITGVAPAAWLVNYKVCDDNGNSDDVTFLAGLEDALNDGMDVVNYSSGSAVIDYEDETGADAQAIANAVSAGMLVVAAAGNQGPEPGTILMPGISPAAISVGAIENQRFFWNSVSVGTLQSYLAIVPDAEWGILTGQYPGTLIDDASVDGNGYACQPLPANSLTNQIVLIQRGPPGNACTFDTKLNNAQNAGALAAIIYDDQNEPIWDYTVSSAGPSATACGSIGGCAELFNPILNTATVPTVFIGLTDGQSIKNQIGSNSGIQGTLDFDGITALPDPSNVVTDFSSSGPTPGANLKPDLVAVGDWFITADTTQYEFFGAYPPYTFFDGSSEAGTSFATPLVTGAIAVVKGQRPGLTALQYKSLIVNSAPEFDQYPNNAIAGPQRTGSGALDVLGSLEDNLAAAPTSIDFQTAGSLGAATQSVRLTDLGTADTFTATVTSVDGVALPSIDVPNFSLNAGGTQTINISLNPSGLAPGQYHGFIVINGTQTQVATRIPYWYAVAGSTVRFVSLQYAPDGDFTGAEDAIVFRLLDENGMPIEGPAPSVTTSSVLAKVLDVVPTGDIPGTYEADIQIGRPDIEGLNTFTITAGGATRNVAIYVQ